MKLFLKTVTPLHIGNGEELYSLDYIFNDNEFYHVSQNLFLQFLKENNLDIKNYSDWIVRNTKEIDALDSEKRQNRRNFGKDKNQQLSALSRNFNLKNYTKVINKFDDFLNFIKKRTYSIQFKNKPKQQIRGIIKNALNKPYIPGTSIKGAIRTALLFDYLNEHENSKNVVNSFTSELNKLKQYPRDKNKIGKNFASTLEQNAFYCGVENKGEIIYSDEKFDLFKLLIISDGNITDDNALTLENLDLYLVAKNKDTGKKKADMQSQTSTIEAVKENTFIEFEIDFNIDLLLTLKQHLKEDKIIVKTGRDKFQKQWVGIETKLKNIFNIDIKNITRENKDEIKEQVINNLLKKIFDFSESQKEWNKNWLENFNANDFGNQYSKKINNGFEKVRNCNNLFHLGFGSGFTGITELLYLMENKDIKAKFKDVMEAFGIGNRPGNKGKFTANPENFPKSKRLITRNDLIIPIGWTEIITQNIISETRKELEAKHKTELEEKQKLEEEKRRKEEDAKKPKYQSIEKLKQGDIIDAVVTGQQGLNVVCKIFVHEQDNEEILFRYASGFPINTIIEVKINQITGGKKGKKKRILNVGFYKQK